ncbi:regulatory protein RecX [Azohydromonas aeria]|uniref:regulatory protein RecX n=1 Tax=Azohydromonas aeria TaxID=2590212 RepID=UPI0012F8CCE5|nr:regulatory protein RecX [Azohydromonas aeria]
MDVADAGDGTDPVSHARSRSPSRLHRSPGPASARPGVFSSAGDAAAPGPAVDTAAAWAEAEAAVEALLEWLQAQRYLSEERFVESRVHARAARFGNLRIRQELAQHGVALDEDAAQRLRDTELERCREVWARKFGDAPPADAAQRARQMRFLAGRGFGADVIRRVLQSCED